MTLNAECLEELKWWVDHKDVWNGKSCLRASPDLALKIQTDASKTVWGAHCEGIKTQGLWTPSEKTLHINVLELKAVLFAVKAFTKNKSDCHIHVKVDNTTTVAYINKMGGTKSPNPGLNTNFFPNLGVGQPSNNTDLSEIEIYLGMIIIYIYILQWKNKKSGRTLIIYIFIFISRFTVPEALTLSISHWCSSL